MTMLLELDGHTVREAHDGLEALELAEAFPPDVILLDVGLPRLNGHEVCRRIRVAGVGARASSLVALTGWGQKTDRLLSQEAGFDHHVVKPVEIDDLRALLAQVRPAGDSPAAPRRPRAGSLVAEVDDEVDAAALDAARQRAVGRRSGPRRSTLQAQELGELVFELELADVAVAEHLAELHEQPLRRPAGRPVTDGPLPGVAGRIELEDVHVERAAQRVGQRRRHEAAGQLRGALAEVGGLSLRQAVGRLVEHDERQDVGLIERRLARKRHRRIAHRAAHRHVRHNAGDDALGGRR